MRGVYEAYRDLSNKTLISENLNNEYPKHFHRNLEMIYVKNGEMNAVVNGNEYVIGKNEIVFVPSFYMHEFSTSKFSDTIVFLIPYEMTSDFSSFFADKTLSEKLDDHDYNKNVLDVLSLMINQKSENNQYIQKGYVSIILGQLIQHYPMHKIKNTEASSTIIKILNYIEANYKEEITLKTLAQRFGYNNSYLSHMLEQYIDGNFRDYLNAIRIQHMIASYKELDNPSITAIALQSGFSNMQTFYRAFAKLYDVPPKEFFDNTLVDSVSHFKIKYSRPKNKLSTLKIKSPEK